VTSDGWLTVDAAVALLNQSGAQRAPKRLREALILGRVTGTGVPVRDDRSMDDGFGQPVDIPPDRWSTWLFNFERQSLDPPSKSRIARGYPSQDSGIHSSMCCVRGAVAMSRALSITSARKVSTLKSSREWEPTRTALQQQQER